MSGAPRLADRRRVIAFDWPGMGQSDAWPGGATPMHLADRLLSLLDGWHIERADVASLDMGGQPALVFAAKPGDATAGGAGKGKVVFFSEQLELTMGRTRILYEELLPRLCALARTHNTRVVIKLHPFESRNQRREFVDAVVPLAERELVEMIEGPLTEELLGNTWFGLTVESSVAVDCAIRGIACFLCQWFATPVTGYDQQYVRYGAARELASPEDVARIPEMLEGFHIAPEVQRGLWNPIAPGKLKEILRKP